MNNLYSFVSISTIIVVVAILLAACTNRNPLPQPTQTGSNTFGCLIDGEPYIPDGGRGFMPSKPVNGGFLVIRSSPYTLGVYIYTYAKNKQRVDIYLNEYTLGRHLLNRNTGIIPDQINPRNYGLYMSEEGNQYTTNSNYTGWVDLTKADTTTGVVAGNFQFEATTIDGRTITISEGRFDVNYRTQ